ncbi:microcephalin [Cylas formicarius]|uniref:microcephalin n=1 Tax=Cylas formicarius TaxID=197179 RepID=UPI002958A22A|nr:microcephalin [Cylas formicarius]
MKPKMSSGYLTPQASKTKSSAKTSEEFTIDDNMFQALMKCPIKKKMIIDLLTANKEAIEECRRSAAGALETRKRYESPTALQRRRALLEMNGGETSSRPMVVRSNAPVPFEKVFEGVVAFVEINSKNQDRSAGAKVILRSMGAVVEDTFTKHVTHVIFKDGSYTTFQKAISRGVHLVSVLWLEFSRKVCQKQPEKEYPAIRVGHMDNNISVICSQMQEEYEAIIREEYRKSMRNNTPLPSTQSFIERRRAILSGSRGSSSTQDTEDEEVTDINFRENVLRPSYTSAMEFTCVENDDRFPKSHSKSPVVGQERRKILKSSAEQASESSIMTSDRSTNISEPSHKISKISGSNRTSPEKIASEPDSFRILHPGKPNETDFSSERKNSSMSELKLSIANCVASLKTPHHSSDSDGSEIQISTRRRSRLRKATSPEGCRRTRSTTKTPPPGSDPEVPNRARTSIRPTRKKEKPEKATRARKKLVYSAKAANFPEETAPTAPEGSTRPRSTRSKSPRTSIKPALKKAEPKKPLPGRKKLYNPRTDVVELPPVDDDVERKTRLEAKRRRASVATADVVVPLVEASRREKSPDLLELLTDVVQEKKPRRRKRRGAEPQAVAMNSSADEQRELWAEIVRERRELRKAGQGNPSLGATVATSGDLRRSTMEFQTTRRRKSKETKRKRKRTPSIVCTKLHRPEVDVFTRIVRKLGGFVVEDEVTARTTHVVAGEPKRTINMLRAVVRGLWVLKFEWVLKSLEHGKWLPEEDYEVTDFGAVIQKSRLQRQAFGPSYTMDVFVDLPPIYVIPGSNPRCSDLRELITACKGIAVTERRTAKIVVGEYIDEDEAICVNEKWILDSISFNKKMPFKEYLLGKRRGRRSVTV